MMTQVAEPQLERSSAAFDSVPHWIDGRRVSGAHGARLRYRWERRPGGHRISVVAIDGAGNRSSFLLRLRLSSRPLRIAP